MKRQILLKSRCEAPTDELKQFDDLHKVRSDLNDAESGVFEREIMQSEPQLQRLKTIQKIVILVNISRMVSCLVATTATSFAYEH